MAALFKLWTGDREHLCGLYRRADAVPLHVKEASRVPVRSLEWA
ncbi:hypothetical protein [Deinococcus sp. QL22]|nr:hypothetical protein [Deinococcus sp. QL22]